MNVAIIDYGSGNLRSAEKAFQRAAADGGLDVSVAVTAEPESVRRAGRIVLPGVGAFTDCMKGLESLPGMVAALNETVIERGRPFLGICVGFQLMATRGLEHGDYPGLNWLPGDVVALKPRDPALKIPHMGWNRIEFVRDHEVTRGLETIGGPDGPHAYFVHSYHFVPEDDAAVLAYTEHGRHITAAAGRDNLIGTQFHPEKSQTLGLALIANFLRWRP